MSTLCCCPRNTGCRDIGLLSESTCSSRLIGAWWGSVDRGFSGSYHRSRPKIVSIECRWRDTIGYGFCLILLQRHTRSRVHTLWVGICPSIRKHRRRTWWWSPWIPVPAVVRLCCVGPVCRHTIIARCHVSYWRRTLLRHKRGLRSHALRSVIEVLEIRCHCLRSPWWRRSSKNIVKSRISLVVLRRPITRAP